MTPTHPAVLFNLVDRHRNVWHVPTALTIVHTAGTVAVSVRIPARPFTGATGFVAFRVTLRGESSWSWEVLSTLPVNSPFWSYIKKGQKKSHLSNQDITWKENVERYNNICKWIELSLPSHGLVKKLVPICLSEFVLAETLRQKLRQALFYVELNLKSSGTKCWTDGVRKRLEESG